MPGPARTLTRLAPMVFCGQLDVVLADPEIHGGRRGHFDPLLADFAGDEPVVVVRLRDDFGGQRAVGAQIDASAVTRTGVWAEGGGGGREKGRPRQDCPDVFMGGENRGAPERNAEVGGQF
jgi:hypothetical protein